MKLQECELIGTKNRFDSVKTWTCLELPVKFIHKPIGEWLCKSCASNLLNEQEVDGEAFDDILTGKFVERELQISNTKRYTCKMCGYGDDFEQQINTHMFINHIKEVV